MRLRSALLLLAACLAVAQGCQVFYGAGKLVGIISPEKFSTRSEAIPKDFQLGANVRDAPDPPTDYEVTFDRSGRATYNVVVRAPQRRQLSGSFEISEAQIASLWKAIATAKFDEMDPRYPSKDDGKDKKVGVQTYYVFADNTEHRVETHFSASAALDSIRAAIAAVIPSEIMAATGAPGRAPKTPNEFIGDLTSHVFHLPTCPLLKDVPPASRQKFADSFRAYDSGFAPCPECKPETTR